MDYSSPFPAIQIIGGIIEHFGAQIEPENIAITNGGQEALLLSLQAVASPGDVYGDLRFDGVRPIPAQFLSKTARIITCGSFSKTAAPGYRIGWLTTEHFMQTITRLKRAYSCSSGLLQQLTLADFLASGDYNRHLKTLRPVLKRNAERMRAMVAEHFPPETRTSQPVGGSVLWLELAGDIDTEELFDAAISAEISIAPGQIFSPSNRYKNFVRLSFGHPWSARTESAIRWLGNHVTKQGPATRVPVSFETA